MLWFVFFSAVVLNDGTYYIGVRENMPFSDEQSCIDYLSDDQNYVREFDHVAGQIPPAKISFACANADDLKDFLLVKDIEI